MGGFFGINAPEYQVNWFKEANKYLAESYKKIEDNKEKYDLALPFYINEVGQELVSIIITKTAETPNRELLLNPATFALFGMGDIIQNNTSVYSLIKQSGKHFDGNKGEVEGHVLKDIPRNLFDFARGLPNYESTKKELETLKGTIAAHQNKQHIGPVYQMYLLCTLIIWDAPDNAKTHLDSLKLKNTEQRLQSVFRRIGKASLTLARINSDSVKEDEKLARSIVAHVLIRYTQEMFKYPPICERLGILETPKVPLTENEPPHIKIEVANVTIPLTQSANKKVSYKLAGPDYLLHAFGALEHLYALPGKDRIVHYYLLTVGKSLIDAIANKPQDYGYKYLCDTATVAILNMAGMTGDCADGNFYRDLWDRTKNEPDYEKKIIDAEKTITDHLNRTHHALIMESIGTNLDELKKSLDIELSHIDREITAKSNELYDAPISEMYNLCTLILNGYEHGKKHDSITRNIGNTTITLNYLHPTEAELFARCFVARILIKYTKEMLKSEPIRIRLVWLKNRR